MAGFIEPEGRDQICLWSQRLDDALPATHPARLMDELFRADAFGELFQFTVLPSNRSESSRSGAGSVIPFVVGAQSQALPAASESLFD